MKLNTIIHNDVLKALRDLPDACVDCIVTSPPYWGLRDYGMSGQIGLEPTLQEYVKKMLEVTEQLKRVLKPSGVLWWNHGDCYGGSCSGGGDKRDKTAIGRSTKLYQKPYPQSKLTPKCKALQNYRLILRMIDEQGWILRNTVIWHKPNHMPSSVKDRLGNSYELVFLLVKNKKYWFDLDSIRQQPLTGKSYKFNQRVRDVKRGFALKSGQYKANERELEQYHGQQVSYNPLGKNPGDVWRIPTQPFPEAHFATFPEKLIEPMIKTGCPMQVCKRCGQPRYKIVERVGIKYDKLNYKKGIKSEMVEFYGKSRSCRQIFDSIGTFYLKTLGWSDCGCNAGFVPGIVLDPFMGAGTTALVALKLNRSFLGIELNKDYIRIATRRIKAWLKK